VTFFQASRIALPSNTTPAMSAQTDSSANSRLRLPPPKLTSLSFSFFCSTGFEPKRSVSFPEMNPETSGSRAPLPE